MHIQTRRAPRTDIQLLSLADPLAAVATSPELLNSRTKVREAILRSRIPSMDVYGNLAASVAVHDWTILGHAVAKMRPCRRPRLFYPQTADYLNRIASRRPSEALLPPLPSPPALLPPFSFNVTPSRLQCRLPRQTSPPLPLRSKATTLGWLALHSLSTKEPSPNSGTSGPRPHMYTTPLRRLTATS